METPDISGHGGLVVTDNVGAHPTPTQQSRSGCVRTRFEPSNSRIENPQPEQPGLDGADRLGTRLDLA